MSGAEVLAWLAKTAGGEAIKKWLGSRGRDAELRALERALKDSHDRRDELEGVREIVEKLANENDALHRELVRLRVENAALRQSASPKDVS